MAVLELKTILSTVKLKAYLNIVSNELNRMEIMGGNSMNLRMDQT